jgi:PPIC-type PPIASE domain
MNGMSIPGTKHDSDLPAAAMKFTWVGFWDPRRVQPARSLVLLTIGTVIGLGIAGYGLFTAKGTVTHSVPPEDLALINQRPILRTDFIAQAEMQYSKPFDETTPAERLSVLDDMVREELFVQRGVELDFPGNDPDTRSALVAAVEQQVVADVTTHVPSNAELEKYFNDHRATYYTSGEMTLHFLVLPGANISDANAVAKIRAAADALRSGASVADVDSHYGLAERGGGRGGIPGEEAFYWQEKIYLGDLVYARAMKLESGDVSEPLPVDGGIAILQMVKHTRPEPLSFEKSRLRVLADYTQAAKDRLEAADENYLRSKSDILVADDYATAYEKYLDQKNAQAAAAAAAQSAAGEQ